PSPSLGVLGQRGSGPARAPSRGRPAPRGQCRPRTWDFAARATRVRTGRESAAPSPQPLFATVRSVGVRPLQLAGAAAYAAIWARDALPGAGAGTARRAQMG